MKFKRRKIKRGRVEIIPMIDTIVILLIFYMTFSRFAEAQRANVTLPKSIAGDDIKEQGKIVINMISTDDVIIDQRHYTTRDLPGVLNQLKEKIGAKGPVAVILRGNVSTLKYSDLSDFMRAVSKAGIADVTFATMEK